MKKIMEQYKPTVHVLKTIQPYFDKVKFGFKTFEVRKDDRNFQVGDVLELREWHEGKFTKEHPVKALITYKLDGGQFGIEKGYCVLGIDISETLLFGMPELKR